MIRSGAGLPAVKTFARCFPAAVRTGIVAAGAFFAPGCANPAKHAASGVFLGEKIATTLDSPEAAYYLGFYLRQQRLQPHLDARIDRLHQTATPNRLPNREELAIVARDFSTDFAALFLADRTGRNPANADFQARFRQHLENPAIGDETFKADFARHLILFAPGWDYKNNGRITGADLARPRQLTTALGIENRLVNLDPHGSVDANAMAIRHAINDVRHAGKRIIVVGASSAGPAIHLALHEISQQGRPAPAAWINLGGILQGSSLVEHMQQPPRSWLFNAILWVKGWKKSAVESMGATRSRPRFAGLRLPSDLLVINYVGLSLSGSLSKFSRDKYPILKREGPNDGLTPLADIIAPGSLTLIAPGSDHFFAEDPRIDEKTVALARAVIALLGEK
jgi:hypothetical protein